MSEEGLPGSESVEFLVLCTFLIHLLDNLLCNLFRRLLRVDDDRRRVEARWWRSLSSRRVGSYVGE
jgi:hypothetical protein